MGSSVPHPDACASHTPEADELAGLLPGTYEELRRMAHGLMARERPGHTLDATALVHEAWLKLAGQAPFTWKSRSQLIGVAAVAIRRILVDYARGKARGKRGGGRARVPLTGLSDVAGLAAPDLLELDDALQRLSEIDATDARVVELRFFAGLSFEEIAEALDLSVRTVRRRWSYARAWLFQALTPGT